MQRSYDSIAGADVGSAEAAGADEATAGKRRWRRVQAPAEGADAGSAKASAKTPCTDWRQYGYEYKRWCGVRRSSWFLAVYTFTYASFLVLGGIMMGIIEKENEARLKEEVYRDKYEFLSRNPSVNESDLEDFLAKMLDKKAQGISSLDADYNNDNWGFGQSFLFTVTVVTTIGYGHVAPLTAEGKLFCIFYSILGIPFTLVFLTASVQRLLEPTLKLLSFFFSKLGSAISPFSIRVIHLIFMSLVFLVFFILLPALAFYYLEKNWTYLDGIYFVFISLTTIGLGDYIPGDDSPTAMQDVYKSVVSVYLLLGLVFMTLTATVFYDIPQLNLGNMLHQGQDIHLPEDTESTTTSLAAAPTSAADADDARLPSSSTSPALSGVAAAITGVVVSEKARAKALAAKGPRSPALPRRK